MESCEGNTRLTKTELENGEDTTFEPEACERMASRYTRLRIMFIFSTVLLLLACVALLVCFLLKNGERRHLTPVCFTVTCMETAFGK